MVVSMHVKNMMGPSKTRSGVVYSGITPEDFQAAKTLLTLRSRAMKPIRVVNTPSHHYNTRHASRMNTPRY